MFVFQAAERMTIMELRPTESGDFEEVPAPPILPDHQVTMLVPHGSFFFAGASDFEEEAPKADDAQGAVVVLFLRGRKELGSTAMGVLHRYALTLQDGNGRLILADVEETVRKQLERTGMLAFFGEENVLHADPKILASARAGLDAGRSVLKAGADRQLEPAVEQDQTLSLQEPKP